MIPRTLEEWTLGSIQALLLQKVFESETFDFKRSLPDPRDSNAKERVAALCAAFANSGGGFLVFGVADEIELTVEQRLVGVHGEIDFPERFGSHARRCQPSVDWTFKNPAIELPGGSLIHVVEVPRSWAAPHAVGSLDKGWRFYKRTNKGNEQMGVDEVRSAFLGFYEKRLKLQMLRAELGMLHHLAGSAYFEDLEKGSKFVSITKFDIRVIDTVLADTFSITASEPTFHETLMQLRRAVNEANTRTWLIHSKMVLPLSDNEHAVSEHNQYMAVQCAQIQRMCRSAIGLLDRIVRGGTTV